MSADDRAAIAGAFPATHAYYAGLVRDPLTEVERYPTPFFEHRYLPPRPPRPLPPGHPLRHSARRDAVLLTDTRRFAALARAAVTAIASPADALAYALAYLELTGPRA